MLAETVSFTEEEILVILLVLVAILMAAAALVGLGCLWAWKAGRGSQAALVGWSIVGALELLAAAAALPSLVTGPQPFVSAPAAALAVQVSLYITAKRRGPG